MKSEEEIGDLLRTIDNKLSSSDESISDWTEHQVPQDESLKKEGLVDRGNVTSDIHATHVQNVSIIKNQYLIDLITCDALWECLGNCSSMNEENINTLIRIWLYLVEHLRNMKNTVTNALRVFSSTRMFSTQGGSLHKYIKDKVLSGRTEDMHELKQFLLFMLHYVPERTPSFLGLIKLMVSSNTDSLDNFLFASMKEVAKTRCYVEKDLEWRDLL